MSRAEAIRKLKRIRKWKDAEYAHVEADRILCLLLDTLGFDDVVKAYHKIPKWFA